jgi:hypothetical protein
MGRLRETESVGDQMATWEEFAADASELAGFGAPLIVDRVCYLATVRATDGGPRVRPVTPWLRTGRLFVRMYPGSPKVRDLEGDARYSMHCGVADDDGGEGEFAVAGIASLVQDPEVLASANAGKPNPDRYVVFHLDVAEAFATVYADDGGPRRRTWRPEPR